MPFFKSTYNILKRPDEDEVFDPNWMDSDTLKLPKHKEWDYGRQMYIEDVVNIESVADDFKSLHSNCEIIDNRHIKGRYDDVLVVYRF